MSNFLGNLNFYGVSGHTYSFEAYPINTKFINECGAIYCFIKQLSIFENLPLYFGRTENIRNRLYDHHKIQACINAGANLIGIYVEHSEQIRINSEIDLIAKYRPIYNELLK